MGMFSLIFVVQLDQACTQTYIHSNLLKKQTKQANINATISTVIIDTQMNSPHDAGKERCLEISAVREGLLPARSLAGCAVVRNLGRIGSRPLGLSGCEGASRQWMNRTSSSNKHFIFKDQAHE